MQYFSVSFQIPNVKVANQQMQFKYYNLNETILLQKDLLEDYPIKKKMVIYTFYLLTVHSCSACRHYMSQLLNSHDFSTKYRQQNSTEVSLSLDCTVADPCQ